MSTEIHVSKILSPTSLVISSGTNDGVDLGDEFNIIQSGIEIIDDFTQKKLGTYDRIKAKVEVTEVFKDFSIAKKLSRKSAMAPILGSSLLGTTTTVEKLPVLETEISNLEIEKFDEIIHPGDKVIKK